MMNVRIIVGGLGILCMNERRGEIGLIEGVPRHSLRIKIYEVVGDDATLVNDIKDVPPGDINVEVAAPEINGVLIDDTEINRNDGPTKDNRQSLRWLLDLERELHRRVLTRNPAKPPTINLRKLLIPNAYFHTAFVREDPGYFLKHGSSISRFGRIGTYMGAMIYGERVSIKAGTDVILDKADDKHYEVIVTNMEANNLGVSDYSNYYHIVNVPELERLKFLSMPRSLQPDEKSDPDKMGISSATSLGIGVHYECWFAYCSETKTIDNFV